MEIYEHYRYLADLLKTTVQQLAARGFFEDRAPGLTSRTASLLGQAIRTGCRLHALSQEKYEPAARDLLARVVHGSRISLSIGVAAVAFGLLVGGILGAVAGFFGGMVDNAIMRACDVFLAVPMMLMAIVIVAALGASITNLVVALAISSVPTFARIVRSAVLGVRDMEYVEAARAVGVKTGRTIARYILPNCMGPIIVQTTLRIAATISNTAALSFLGLGVKPPQPEWGALLSSGREFIRDSAYLACIPGVCIMLTILALNLLGDGRRDALDPRLK